MVLASDEAREAFALGLGSFQLPDLCLAVDELADGAVQYALHHGSPVVVFLHEHLVAEDHIVLAISLVVAKELERYHIFLFVEWCVSVTVLGCSLYYITHIYLPLYYCGQVNPILLKKSILYLSVR